MKRFFKWLHRIFHRKPKEYYFPTMAEYYQWNEIDEDRKWNPENWEDG